MGKSPVKGWKFSGKEGVRAWWFCSGLRADKKQRQFCDFLNFFLEAGGTRQGREMSGHICGLDNVLVFLCP